MKEDEFQKHLDEMFRHEGIFWDRMDEEDEVRNKIQAIQNKLEAVTKPCFEEPMRTYSIFTRKLFTRG